MKYKVYDSGKPAICSNYDQYEFDTFEEARKYVDDWLGRIAEYYIPLYWDGKSITYSDTGNTIEIRKEEVKKV
jgi:hypothetical protein